MFVLAEGFYREQRNGPEKKKKDGMCGQEGRLPCQHLSPDKDMKIMGETCGCPLLTSEFKQRKEFILIAKTLFPPQQLALYTLSSGLGKKNLLSRMP